MKREARDRRPRVKPVERIELDEKNIKPRAVLFFVLLAVGITALIYGVCQIFKVQTGWQAIECSEDDASFTDELLLEYDIGDGDMSARNELKSLRALYGEAAAAAYRAFSDNSDHDGGVASLESRPNESVHVDELLYGALEKLDAAGSRQLYLAPVYEMYVELFLSADDEEAAEHDPSLGGDAAELVKNILTFSGDPDSISVELLGDGDVRLNVSEEYLSFAEENELEPLIGFHWMKNAFAVDSIADALAEVGFTNGYITSLDGFCRNLDSRGVSFSLNLFDRVGNEALSPGVLNYTGPLSLVSLRTFPVNSGDSGRYYIMENGETRFPYIDENDGLCRAALSNLVCTSPSLGCADILLRIIPAYVTNNFSEDALTLDIQIDATFCRDGVIYSTTPDSITADGYEIGEFRALRSATRGLAPGPRPGLCPRPRPGLCPVPRRLLKKAGENFWNGKGHRG